MKTATIFCVLATVCLFGIGYAEADLDRQLVIDTLTKELKSQVDAESTKLDNLIGQAYSKLKSAVADIDKAEKPDDLKHCLQNAREMLDNGIANYKEELNKCSSNILSNAEASLSSLSPGQVNPFIKSQLSKASVCNVELTRKLRRVVIKVRSSANRYCAYLNLIPHGDHSQSS